MHGSHYVQLENNGSAVHRAMTSLSAAGSVASLSHRLDWISQQGRPVVDEQRSLTAAPADPDTWTLVFSTAMTNVSGGALPIGSPTTKGRENAGYGGLFWRGPRSFTNGIVQSPAGTGGTRAEWFAFRGKHDGTGRSSTVLMVDDTANPQHPPQWFTRSEEFACLNPAPFFSAEVGFGPGETLRFRYAVVIAGGDRGDERAAALADVGRRALASAPSHPAAAESVPA